MMDNLSIAHKKSRAFALEIDGAFAQDVLTDALRVHVGRGKAHSLDTLSYMTGIKRVTLKGYQAGENCPSLAKMLRLMMVLPDRFSEDFIRLAGFNGIKRIEGEGMSIGAFSCLVNKMGATLAQMAVDGVLDHQEKAQLIPILEDFIRKMRCMREAL